MLRNGLHLTCLMSVMTVDFWSIFVFHFYTHFAYPDSTPSASLLSTLVYYCWATSILKCNCTTKTKTDIGAV